MINREYTQVLKYIRGYEVGVSKPNVLRAWAKLFTPKITNMIFRFSTSIQNFADRVRNQNDVQEWTWKSFWKQTVFLGLYHEGDWIRFLLHRGPRLAFWCGGDVLRLAQKPLWRWLVSLVKADHVCENIVEKKQLAKMGIQARIHPILFFDDIDKYKVTFKPSKKPHVWMTCHQGRETEYGVRDIESIAGMLPDITFHVLGSAIPWIKRDNVKFHGWIPTEEVDKIIRKCQAGFRGNEFDGCPHTVTKGILHGQYPINRIPYPFTESYETKEELIKILKSLKHRTKPNLAGREYWLPILTQFPWA